MKRLLIMVVAGLLLAGQAYAGNFTDNGNGTVIDKNTGLMWQKEDDGNTYNWYVAAGINDTNYNPTTKSVCGKLTLADYSDWRLPSNTELMSIVDSSIPEPGPGPTIDEAYFPRTKPSVYWSSTQDSAAYGTVFRSGNIFVGWRGNLWYVRCVRGGK